jgi:hypothetical protein
LPSGSVHAREKRKELLTALTICLAPASKSVHRKPRNTPSEIHFSKDEGSDNSPFFLMIGEALALECSAHYGESWPIKMLASGLIVFVLPPPLLRRRREKNGKGKA